jgi:hypothetical protein
VAPSSTLTAAVSNASPNAENASPSTAFVFSLVVMSSRHFKFFIALQA